MLLNTITFAFYSEHFMSDIIKISTVHDFNEHCLVSMASTFVKTNLKMWYMVQANTISLVGHS